MQTKWVVLAACLMTTPAWAQSGGGMAERLAALDLNNDGVISSREMQAVRRFGG